MLGTITDSSLFHERSLGISIFHFIFRKKHFENKKNLTMALDERIIPLKPRMNIDASINICPLFCYGSLNDQRTSRT